MSWSDACTLLATRVSRDRPTGLVLLILGILTIGTGLWRSVVERPEPALDRGELVARVAAELSRQGAAPVRIVVEAVETIPRGALGKAPLVRREP